MLYGYANGNAKRPTSRQVETINERFPKLKVGIEEKGSKDEYEFLIDAKKTNKALGRGKGHSVVVAEFHDLATNRDDLVERVATIHGLGSFIIQASDGLSTEDRANCPRLVVDAIEFYESGLTRKRRSEIGAHAAKFSPVTQPKPGRMPNKEAQPYFMDVSLTVPEVCVLINKVKKYKVPWTASRAYREKRLGRLDFPDRAAGPRSKQT